MSGRPWAAFLPTSAERFALWAPPSIRTRPDFLLVLAADALRLALLLKYYSIAFGVSVEQAGADVGATILKEGASLVSGVNSAVKTLGSDVGTVVNDLEHIKINL